MNPVSSKYPGVPVPIKGNAVRKVWRQGDYFFKAEKRKLFYSKAKREFASLKLLADKGIPAVEAVEVYSENGFDVLVTRAWESDAVTAELYYDRSEGRDRDFLRSWLELIRQILHSGLCHPDLHNGNILYSPGKKTTALVDTYGVGKSKLNFSRRRFKMERIFLELREFMPYDELKTLWEANCSGCDFETALRLEAKMREREMPKRLGQVKNNYPKFVITSSDAVRRAAAPSGGFRQLQSERRYAPEAELNKLWLRHFYWQLHRIPHQRATELGRDFISLEYANPVPDSPAVRKYLQHLPQESMPQEIRFGKTSDGREIVLL